MAGTDELAPLIQPSQPQKKRKPLGKVGLAVIGVVVLLVGVGIGAAGANNQSQVNSLKAKLSTADTKLQVAQDQVISDNSAVSTAQANAATAESNAKNAQAIADKKAAATYASKMASVNALQKKLEQEQGIVLANTISEDGVYVVGQDIKPGTYHTSGDGGQGDDACYYATLNSTNTNDIIDNNNFDGPETVDVTGAYAFQISGGCTWTLETG
jgi:hypothetical protein